MIGSSLRFVRPLELPAGFPRLEAYLRPLAESPAFQAGGGGLKVAVTGCERGRLPQVRLPRR